jgi:hypothetical protein
MMCLEQYSYKMCKGGCSLLQQEMHKGIIMRLNYCISGLGEGAPTSGKASYEVVSLYLGEAYYISRTMYTNILKSPL